MQQLYAINTLQLARQTPYSILDFLFANQYHDHTFAVNTRKGWFCSYLISYTKVASNHIRYYFMRSPTEPVKLWQPAFWLFQNQAIHQTCEIGQRDFTRAHPCMMLCFVGNRIFYPLTRLWTRHLSLHNSFGFRLERSTARIMETPRQLGLNKKSRFSLLCHSSEFCNLYNCDARDSLSARHFQQFIQQAALGDPFLCYRYALLPVRIVITTCVSSWQIGNQIIDFDFMPSRRI